MKTLNIMKERLKDHVFEWFLAQCLAGKAQPTTSHARPVKRRPSAPIRTDIKNVYLRYDDQAQLNLADVKPTGFLVKSNA